MPIHVDISALNRTILIVARGHVSDDEIIGSIEKMKAPAIRGYAKIVDVTGSTSFTTREKVSGIAKALRGGPDATPRGPLAFVVDPEREGFAEVFAEATGDDRPIKLFESLHEARRWLAENLVEIPGQPAVRSRSR